MAKNKPHKSEQHPLSKSEAPDPCRSYERSRPEDEAGMGRLHAEKARPSNKPDRPHEAVANRQDPTHQINADDAKPVKKKS